MPFRANRPITLGIIGDSGAGKTTLATGCVHVLGPERVTDICLDDYHAYDRAERRARKITALHPDCNHLDLMAQHISLLRQGQRIFKPVYDHSSGRFARPEFVTPKSIVLVHGLHGLITPELRSQWDVSVFLDPHPSLRTEWKIGRDTRKRGYTREQVLEQLAHRQHDSEAHIMPQRANADIVIAFCPPAAYARTRDNTKLDVKITLRHPVPLPDLPDLVATVMPSKGEPSVRLMRGDEGIDILELAGSMDDATATVLEDRFWEHMPNARHLRSRRLGKFVDGDTIRRSNTLSVTQLVLTYYLVKASALVVKDERVQREREEAGR